MRELLKVSIIMNYWRAYYLLKHRDDYDEKVKAQQNSIMKQKEFIEYVRQDLDEFEKEGVKGFKEAKDV